jgi:beta-glucosidase
MTAPTDKVGISRRKVIAGAALGAAASVATPSASGAEPQPAQSMATADFLWGTALSAYQSEGNNSNADAWLEENITPTLFAARSGDACDSYHRYEKDFAIAASLGFNCYRFGIERARIEPSDGFWSNAELDHYARVLEACRRHGLKPVVTFNHFTVPLWFAARGGFAVDDAPQLFARFCRKAADHLGGLMHLATTFNEANLQLLVQIMPGYATSLPAAQAMIRACAKATASPRFSTMAYADPAISMPLMQEAHRQAYTAIKAARPSLPVGLTLTTQAIQAVGQNSLAELYEKKLYGGWITVARTHADFIGVQPNTRFLVDASGIIAPPKGSAMTDAGYEYYPQAVGEVIRWAHRAIGKPIYVTENGIATNDDRRRITFINSALASLRQCRDDGIAVHSYLYWSLLDNFEWTSGYRKHFGLVAVDLKNFTRTLKPSAFHLGGIARVNRI